MSDSSNKSNTKSNAGTRTTNGDSSLIETRRQYESGTLYRENLHASPTQQFEHWLRDAREAKLIDATSVALTTVDSNNRPHTRIVLLKQYNEQGFIWFTDRSSDKGQHINANSAVCMLFFWHELERQVRIEGRARKVADSLSDEYFYSRPEGSRFSAAASNQSRVVSNRQVLETQVASLREKYVDGNVPRPEQWGGYCLEPDYFEFWQGRNDRLHDRFVYRLEDSAEKHNSNQQWSLDRLSP